MELLKNLTKDIENIDLDKIIECWQWLLHDMAGIITISVIGDIFLLGKDGAVYWLQTDSGMLKKEADSLLQFEQYLNDNDKIDNWFLPLLVEKLEAAGKVCKYDQVYSYKKLPVLGGAYELSNIEPRDMQVHFALSGQICEQIKDLPDGTCVTIQLPTNL